MVRLQLLAAAAAAAPLLVSSFQPRPIASCSASRRSIRLQSRLSAAANDASDAAAMDRRSAVKNMAAALVTASTVMSSLPRPANAKSDPATKSGAYNQSKANPDFVQKYEDFQLTDEGWSYKDGEK